MNDPEDGAPVRSSHTAPDGHHVVLGIGNILNRDEGVGVEALKALSTRLGDTTAVDLVDGGVLGLNLLPLVEESAHLLVLDAIDAGAAPGTVIELARDDIPLFNGVKMSEHQVSFQEVLGLSLMRGHLPPFLHLLGIQPDDISIGLGLGDVVQRAVPELVERAVAVLRGWELVGDLPPVPSAAAAHIGPPSTLATRLA